MELSILNFKGVLVKFLSKDVFLSLKIVSFLANSAVTDVLPLYATFHHDLHCLPKNLFTRIHNLKE